MQGEGDNPYCNTGLVVGAPATSLILAQVRRPPEGGLRLYREPVRSSRDTFVATTTSGQG
jgi:hypothetical protein